MTFLSRKDLTFTIIISLVCTLLISIVCAAILNIEAALPKLWPLFVILLVVIFLLWIFFDTRYELTDTHLKYRSGPIKGKIEIHAIREIEKNKTLWVGLKPATATKGLIVKYNKFDEIYISPQTNDTFINKLLERNSNIKIIDKI